jgi:hypothetical protein
MFVDDYDDLLDSTPNFYASEKTITYSTADAQVLLMVNKIIDRTGQHLT